MTNKQIFILAILLIYMAANMILGIRMSRKSAKEHASSGFIQNYFMGSRSMGGLVLAMTLVATYTSASSFLGGPGLAASWGLTQSWVAAIQIGTAFLTLGVVGKKFAIISRKTGSVTVTDYFKARYQSPTVVILCGICLVVFFLTQMVAQFIGGATLVESVTGLPYWAGLALFGGIVILYTTIGGFKAVVITDTFQGIIMTIGTFLLLFFVIRAGGGMSEITGRLDTLNPGWDILGKGEFSDGLTALSPGYMISFWILVGAGVLGLPQTAVRGMGFRDTQSMHRAMIYGTVVVGILMIGMHFAGTLTAPLLPEGGIGSTDQVIPYVVLNYMPTWAAGFFLAAPLAAVMSTVSSLLILASATIIKDLYITYVLKEDSPKTPAAARQTAINGSRREAAEKTADSLAPDSPPNAAKEGARSLAQDSPPNAAKEGARSLAPDNFPNAAKEGARSLAQDSPQNAAKEGEGARSLTPGSPQKAGCGPASQGSLAALEKRVPFYSFLITVILGLIVFAFALVPPDIIVWINLFAMGGLEATFFWPLIGGLYWKRGNALCCICSIIAGVSTFLFFNQVKIAPFHIHEIVLGLLAGGAAYFAAGLLSKTEPDGEMLKKCF